MAAFLVFFLVLLVLVVIHEFGHYLAARWAGVRVLEFGIGIPPRAKVLFHYAKTAFTLNWIPFGGFVRLAGDESETVESAGADKSEQVPDSEKFSEKSKFRRMVILLGGITMNILFGMVAFSIVYSVSGVPEQTELPYVLEVSVESPAQEAGIQVDDEILAINDMQYESVGEVITAIRAQQGETATVTIRREGAEQSLEVYVRTAEETPAEQGSMGVVLADVRVTAHPWWVMIPRGIELGVRDSILFAREILVALGSIFTSVFRDQSFPADLAGPVGIVHTVQQAGIVQQGPLAILYFAGVISINLAIMNLLPIPGLDGGRGVFVMLEFVLGKRRRAAWEARANSVGMLFLLGLILLISMRDIARIVLQ